MACHLGALAHLNSYKPNLPAYSVPPSHERLVRGMMAKDTYSVPVHWLVETRRVYIGQREVVHERPRHPIPTELQWPSRLETIGISDLCLVESSLGMVGWRGRFSLSLSSLRCRHC